MTRRALAFRAAVLTLTAFATSSACALAATVSRAHVPQPAWSGPRIFDLGAVVGGGAVDVIPTAINNADQVVGYDGGPGTNGNPGAAYLINPDGSFAVLGKTGIDGNLWTPSAISNSGKSIVGDASLIGVPSLQSPSIPVYGFATWSVVSARSAVQNYAGALGRTNSIDPHIANGNVAVAGNDFYGFLTPTSGTFPSQGCAITDFSALGINDAGTIVGSGGGYAAYGSTTGCAAPVVLPRPANASTQAHGINSAGDLLVSFTGPAAPAFGAEYLVKDGRYSRVGLPPTFSNRSVFLVACGISDGDEVVGDIRSQIPPFAPVAPFAYRAGTSIDLNASLPARSGWTLLTAAAVSASGVVVGTGYHNGALRGYALQP